jgi:hypothetical protein
LPIRVIEHTTDHYGRKTKTGEHIEEAKDKDIEEESRNKKEREFFCICIHNSNPRFCFMVEARKIHF